MRARCIDSTRQADEAAAQLTAAQDRLSRAAAAHQGDVARLQTDLQLAEKRVLRAVMEGEEMHVKLLTCEALLAGTVEERGYWEGELGLKEGELREARALALAALEGGDMAGTIVEDCDVLLAHIAEARGRLAVVRPPTAPAITAITTTAATTAATAAATVALAAARSTDSLALSPSTPLAASPHGRSPASSVTPASVSHDLLAARQTLETLRERNRSLTAEYEALRAQLAQQTEAAAAESTTLRALVVRAETTAEARDSELRAVRTAVAEEEARRAQEAQQEAARALARAQAELAEQAQQEADAADAAALRDALRRSEEAGLAVAADYARTAGRLAAALADLARYEGERDADLRVIQDGLRCADEAQLMGREDARTTRELLERAELEDEDVWLSQSQSQSHNQYSSSTSTPTPSPPSARPPTHTPSQYATPTAPPTATAPPSSATVASLRKKVQTLAREKNEATAAADALRLAVAAAESAKHHLAAEAASLREQLLAAGARQEGVAAQRASESGLLEDELQRATEEKKRHAAEASALRAELLALGAEAAAASERGEGEVRALRASYEAAEAARRQVEGQLQGVRVELAASCSCADALDGQVRERDAAVAAVTGALAEKEREHRLAVEECARAEAALQLAQEELSALRASMLAECEGLRAKLAAAAAAQQASEASYASLQSRLEGVLRERAAQDEALALAQRELADVQASRDQLQGELTAMRAELARLVSREKQREGGSPAPESAAALQGMLAEVRAKRQWLRDALRAHSTHSPGGSVRSSPQSSFIAHTPLLDRERGLRERGVGAGKPSVVEGEKGAGGVCGEESDEEEEEEGEEEEGEGEGGEMDSPEVRIVDVYGDDSDGRFQGDVGATALPLLAAAQLERSLQGDLQAVRQSKMTLQRHLFAATPVCKPAPPAVAVTVRAPAPVSAAGWSTTMSAAEGARTEGELRLPTCVRTTAAGRVTERRSRPESQSETQSQSESQSQSGSQSQSQSGSLSGLGSGFGLSFDDDLCETVVSSIHDGPPHPSAAHSAVPSSSSGGVLPIPRKKTTRAQRFASKTTSAAVAFAALCKDKASQRLTLTRSDRPDLPADTDGAPPVKGRGLFFANPLSAVRRNSTSHKPSPLQLRPLHSLKVHDEDVVSELGTCDGSSDIGVELGGVGAGVGGAVGTGGKTGIGGIGCGVGVAADCVPEPSSPTPSESHRRQEALVTPVPKAQAATTATTPATVAPTAAAAATITAKNKSRVSMGGLFSSRPATTNPHSTPHPPPAPAPSSSAKSPFVRASSALGGLLGGSAKQDRQADRRAGAGQAMAVGALLGQRQFR